MSRRRPRTPEENDERNERRRLQRILRRQETGEPGAYCQICGDGPYVKLVAHTWRMHRVNRREYLRRFPGADLTHPDLKHAFRLEAVERGAGGGSARRQTCRRGHPMRGSNVRRDKDGKRTCKRCHYAAHVAYIKRKQAESGTKLCECGCGKEIPKLTLNGTPQRFAKGHYDRTHLRRPLAGQV